jgi:hypothetical protein
MRRARRCTLFRSVSDHDTLFDPIRQARIDKSAKQPGDPDKAAEAILTLVGMKDPPPCR